MIWKIAWKNIVHRPLNSILCIALIMLGTGIISLLSIVETEMGNRFKNNKADIDLVVGAKGSPLQLVLSAVYHIDSPPGNINLEEAQELMQDPLVETAIPLSYGDSFKGNRILGTTPEFITNYSGILKDGRFNEESMEVVLGNNVADQNGLELGGSFYGTHGEANDGHVHDNAKYEIVGILEQSNSVLDNLIITNLESVWEIHGHYEGSQSSNHNDHDHDHDHDHEHEHDFDHGHEHQEVNTEDLEITALLIKCKTKIAELSLPRRINQETNMQAALPGLEINKLFSSLGVGISTVKFVGVSVVFMAGFSVFLILLDRLKRRKSELAVMRTLGYSSAQLFSLLICEGIILAIVGCGIGLIMSRIGVYIVNSNGVDSLNFKLHYSLVHSEVYLVVLTLSVGLVSAFFPAIKAMRTNVSSILKSD